MSVDVVAELPAPVSLAAVLEGARDTLRALLGAGSELPELAVFDEWRVEGRSRVSSGRPLSAEDLTSAMIGERILPDEGISRDRSRSRSTLSKVRIAPM